MEQDIIKNSKKIVIKIGSSTITSKDGVINKKFLDSLASQVKSLIAKGKQVVIVSSGARIAGVSTLCRWSRKEDVNYKQALCAIGQVELMDSYRIIFNKYNVHVAQILLTREDFNDSSRTLNIRNTLFTLLDENVIPIVNENDTVCVEEIKIGDNDMLAAQTTVLWNADLLIILSDINGIYDKSPVEHKDAKLIELVDDIDELEKNISIGRSSSFGTGGISTKLKAARLVNKFDINMIVANGKKDNIIEKLESGEEKGTVFI
ncbi:glutamate 5-kinase [Anaerosalibacter massiliensis]|uniref:glutamate 5-kinase n=1 Tax=Anaerosalibacter massiliensis TaxID=1347392 RepID=UPI0005B29140|nr:glutamate 5-kinase [Anaerosalibacter massiliensis]